jgi:Protein of unknown function (DUF3305)
MSTSRPSLEVSVIMRREPIVGAMSRWQSHRWVLEQVVLNGEVVPGSPSQDDPIEIKSQLLSKNDSTERWIHAGYRAKLFADDAEGYYLNVTTDAPCWFVLWRMEEEAGITDEPIAKPEMVSLSYHDAGRWLDAQETVEQVPLPPEVVAWLQAFVDEHHVNEAKKRKRPESFKRLEDRFGNPASISTEKNMGGGFRGGNNHG